MTRKITFNGEIHSLSKWARKLGVPLSTVSYRHNHNLPLEVAVARCICGREFVHKGNIKKFCSIECRPSWRKRHPPKRCRCGTIFINFDGSNRHIYCSVNCSDAARSEYIAEASKKQRAKIRANPEYRARARRWNQTRESKITASRHLAMEIGLIPNRRKIGNRPIAVKKEDRLIFSAFKDLGLFNQAGVIHEHARD
jgi:hypothetical protein